MPVTTRIITAESGSTRKAMSTFSVPRWIQGKRLSIRKRFSGSNPVSVKKGVQGQAESENHRRASQEADGALAPGFLNLRAQQAVDDRADQRQEDDPAQVVGLYRIIHNSSWLVLVARARRNRTKHPEYPSTNTHHEHVATPSASPRPRRRWYGRSGKWRARWPSQPPLRRRRA